MDGAVNREADAGTFLFGRNGAMLRQIIDGAAIGMAVAGLDGRALYCNQAFVRDFSPTGFSDGFCLDHIFARDDLEGQQALANVLAGRAAAHEGEYRCRDARGHTMWALVALSALNSDTTGQPLYVILQVNSIEERKAAETAMVGAVVCTPAFYSASLIARR